VALELARIRVHQHEAFGAAQHEEDVERVVVDVQRRGAPSGAEPE
jgi:hypothetical protein